MSEREGTGSMLTTCQANTVVLLVKILHRKQTCFSAVFHSLKTNYRSAKMLVSKHYNIYPVVM